MPAPSKDEKRYGKHPTQKPIALIARCLRASTNEDDLVFDPFSGSATTGVASLMLKRQFIGCEMDKKFVAIANHRLSSATGTFLPTEPKEHLLWSD
jgi:site-specific DNA-methyltransferase (adenine-specific)